MRKFFDLSTREIAQQRRFKPLAKHVSNIRHVLFTIVDNCKIDCSTIYSAIEDKSNIAVFFRENVIHVGELIQIIFSWIGNPFCDFKITNAIIKTSFIIRFTNRHRFIQF